MNRLTIHSIVAPSVLVLLAALAAPGIDLTKEKVVYDILYAHLDTQWQWTLAATTSSYIPNTLHSNFSYFQQYPEYKFNFEGAFRYWLAKINGGAAPGPGYRAYDYDTLKYYIRQGRWMPIGRENGCRIKYFSAAREQNKMPSAV